MQLYCGYLFGWTSTKLMGRNSCVVPLMRQVNRRQLSKMNTFPPKRVEVVPSSSGTCEQGDQATALNENWVLHLDSARLRSSTQIRRSLANAHNPPHSSEFVPRRRDTQIAAFPRLAQNKGGIRREFVGRREQSENGKQSS